MKIKSIGIKLSTYIDFDVENNDKEPKFEFIDYAGISKYKNILVKMLQSRLVRRSFCD